VAVIRYSPIGALYDRFTSGADPEERVFMLVSTVAQGGLGSAQSVCMDALHRDE
jgi:hypothetical protein